MNKRLWFLFLILILLVISIIIFLNKKDRNYWNLNENEFIHDNGLVFLNTALEVKYTGMSSCLECHKSTHTAFSNSEMHRSFEKLDSSNVIEIYPQSHPIHDPETNYYYEMIRKNNRFYQREFRNDLEGNIIYERFVEAEYTIGSGNNLRMYFYDENGMFYQLPLTWNSHKKVWDLSPGFRESGNLRFTRYATKRCIGCHNSYLTELETAIDRFKKPYEIGIGCERCHGPGELHIKEMKEKIEKKIPENFKTIVNPRKLSSDRQLSVCMQCHLQGKAWAPNADADWFDFRPGQLLSQNRSVYFPTATEKKVIEVGDSPHRLMMSKCYTKSNGEMTCISCHDPHFSINTFSISYYNEKCISCHQLENIEKKSTIFIHSKNDSCINCHMNRTGSDNTLHGVSLTDHWIRTDANKTVIDWSSLKLPLDSRSSISLFADIDYGDNGRNLRKGIAYLDYYKENDSRIEYLDSSITYLNIGIKENPASSTGNYHLGEANYFIGNNNQAKFYLTKVIQINPKNAQAYFKLGEVYEALEMLDSAIASYVNAVELFPDEPFYLEGLAVAYLKKGNITYSLNYLLKSI